jgi:predicted RNA-binding Zn-ribbon protein involved in translation (DUF1610 family)
VKKMFRGFICTATGEKVLAEECKECARWGAKEGCNLTSPIVAGMLGGLRKELKFFSVSEIVGCPRKARLIREVDYWLKPEELYWAFRGQIAHGLAALYAPEGVIVEGKFEMKVDQYVVVGHPDYVDKARKLIVDYKTTKRLPGSWKVYRCPHCGEVVKESEWKVRKGEIYVCPRCGRASRGESLALTEMAPRARGHHERQVNLYALILHHNGIEVERGEIVYLDMEGVLRVEVPIHPFQETREFLEERLKRLLSEELPPPLKRDSEDSWECKYCPVVEACGDRGEKEKEEE